MKTKQNTLNIIIGLVVLVIIALLVAWSTNRPNTQDTNDTVTPGENIPVVDELEDETPLLQPSNRLIVSNQRVGSTIDIDEIKLAEPGFVAIHADNAGQPGPIIARSNLLPIGTRADLVINYKTTAGTSYIAMLHSDDGDGKFDANKDLPIMGSDNRPITVMFSVVP